MPKETREQVEGFRSKTVPVDLSEWNANGECKVWITRLSTDVIIAGGEIEDAYARGMEFSAASLCEEDGSELFDSRDKAKTWIGRLPHQATEALMLKITEFNDLDGKKAAKNSKGRKSA